jgi:uncharacterized membrane protein
MNAAVAPSENSSPVGAPERNVTRIAWPHVVLALIGGGISAYAVHAHNLVKAGGSACGYTETISCDKVLASYWGAPLGIPLGYFGLLFFAIVLVTAISTLPASTPQRKIVLPRLLLATAGICSSFALTFISMTQIHALCPICLATHATTLCNFLVALWSYMKARKVL